MLMLAKQLKLKTKQTQNNQPKHTVIKIENLLISEDIKEYHLINTQTT